MAEQLNGQEKKHTITLLGRSVLEISGAREVESFDEQEVVLETDCGRLTVEGEGLHVGVLDIAKGAVSVTGKVNTLYYSDAAPAKRGLRQRFFG